MENKGERKKGEKVVMGIIIFFVAVCIVMSICVISAEKAEKEGFGMGALGDYEVIEVTSQFTKIVYNKETEQVFLIYYIYYDTPSLSSTYSTYIPMHEPYKGPNGKCCYYKDKKIIEEETGVIVKNYEE